MAKAKKSETAKSWASAFELLPLSEQWKRLRLLLHSKRPNALKECIEDVHHQRDREWTKLAKVAQELELELQPVENFNHTNDRPMAARDRLVEKLISEGRLTHGQIRMHAEVIALNDNKKLRLDQLKGIKRRRKKK